MQLDPRPRTVLADVPFCFDNQATRAAANNHYDLMTIQELKETYKGPCKEHSRAKNKPGRKPKTI